MKIIFIADFFADQVLGGGELNNEELIKILDASPHQVTKINSHLVTPFLIEAHKDAKFIVANFMNLQQHCLDSLLEKDYTIYEHDHKYLTTRDPAHFENFIAPPEAIINKEFYRNAIAVFCQSQFHLDIIKKNLDIDNLINLSGNLWSTGSIELIERCEATPKGNSCAIMDSPIAHKNTREAVMYCEHKKMPYNLIASANYKDFLFQMSRNNTFVFFPKTPETLSRVIVEARMMGMRILTNKNVGASQEAWYEEKGKQLIKEVINMRKRIPKTVLEMIE